MCNKSGRMSGNKPDKFNRSLQMTEVFRTGSVPTGMPVIPLQVTLLGNVRTKMDPPLLKDLCILQTDPGSLRILFVEVMGIADHNIQEPGPVFGDFQVFINRLFFMGPGVNGFQRI